MGAPCLKICAGVERWATQAALLSTRDSKLDYTFMSSVHSRVRHRGLYTLCLKGIRMSFPESQVGELINAPVSLDSYVVALDLETN